MFQFFHKIWLVALWYIVSELVIKPSEVLGPEKGFLKYYFELGLLELAAN